jgi:hypothetical protein
VLGKYEGSVERNRVGLRVFLPSYPKLYPRGRAGEDKLRGFHSGREERVVGKEKE